MIDATEGRKCEGKKRLSANALTLLLKSTPKAEAGRAGSKSYQNLNAKSKYLRAYVNFHDFA